MTPMFSIFTLDQIWLLISYHLSKVSFICWFYFWQISPPPLNICFKRCFKSLFSPLQCIKQSWSAKNVVFSHTAFWSTCQWGGGGYSPPAPLATLLDKNVVFSLFCILVGSSLAPPPQINVSNYALNHFLVQSSAKKSLRSAKNVVFSLFCILVGRPPPPPPPPGYATAHALEGDNKLLYTLAIV